MPLGRSTEKLNSDSSAPKKCPHCGKSFKFLSSKKKYCSGKCKGMAYFARHKEIIQTLRKAGK